VDFGRQNVVHLVEQQVTSLLAQRDELADMVMLVFDCLRQEFSVSSKASFVESRRQGSSEVEDVTPYFFQGDVNRVKGFLIDDTANSSDLGTPK
jgi:hypothetical protein